MSPFGNSPGAPGVHRGQGKRVLHLSAKSGSSPSIDQANQRLGRLEGALLALKPQIEVGGHLRGSGRVERRQTVARHRSVTFSRDLDGAVCPRLRNHFHPFYKVISGLKQTNCDLWAVPPSCRRWLRFNRS